jgi:hypothetical protein
LRFYVLLLENIEGVSPVLHFLTNGQPIRE